MNRRIEGDSLSERMPGAEKFPRVKIASIGVVSPYGIGIEPLWTGLQSQKSKISKKKFGTLKEHYFLAGLCDWKEMSLKEMMEESIDQVLKNYVGSIDLGEVELVIATALGDIKHVEKNIFEGSYLKSNHMNGGFSLELFGEYSFQKIYQDIQIEFGLAGKGVIISTTCTSSQNALLYAVSRIRLGAKGILVVGGDQVSQTILHGLNSVRALSNNEVKPLDKARDGLAVGEGAGAILLQPSSGSGDRGFAILDNISSFNESISLSSPKKSAEGLLDCLMNLNIREKHTILLAANGGVYNDAALATSIKVFYANEYKNLKITAVKGYIGHTLGASGIIETIVGIMMLAKKQAIPICGLENPEELDLPFVMKPEAFMGEKLLYLSSGFGGNCTALVLC